MKKLLTTTLLALTTLSFTAVQAQDLNGLLKDSNGYFRNGLQKNAAQSISPQLQEMEVEDEAKSKLYEKLHPMNRYANDGTVALGNGSQDFMVIPSEDITETGTEIVLAGVACFQTGEVFGVPNHNTCKAESDNYRQRYIDYAKEQYKELQRVGRLFLTREVDLEFYHYKIRKIINNVYDFETYSHVWAEGRMPAPVKEVEKLIEIIHNLDTTVSIDALTQARQLLEEFFNFFITKVDAGPANYWNYTVEVFNYKPITCFNEKGESFSRNIISGFRGHYSSSTYFEYNTPEEALDACDEYSID